MPDLAQDLLVHPDADGYRVLGQIDRASLHASPDAAAAIQWALDTLTDGGEVRLTRGEYPLARPLRLGSSQSLVGSGRGAVLRVTAEAGVGVVLESVKGASVADLAVIAAGPDAAVGVDLVTAGDCRVHGVLAQGFAEHGVRVRDNAFLCRVTDCSLAGNRVSNLKFHMLAKDGPFGTYLPNTAIGCTTYGGGAGVETHRAIVLTLNGIQVHQATGPAFHVHTTSNAVSLVGCRTFQTTGPAVLFEDSHEVSITGNVFSWPTEEGVVLRRCRWGTVTGNNVIDVGSHNPGGPDQRKRFADLDAYPPSFPGVVLEDCRGFTVTGNALFNWPVCPPMTDGVVEDEASADNVIVGNNANYFRGDAVVSRGTQTVSHANAGYGPEPLCRNPPIGERPELFIKPGHPIQSFQPELTRQFIDTGFEGIDA